MSKNKELQEAKKLLEQNKTLIKVLENKRKIRRAFLGNQ
jgi:hypothetical protein